MKCPDCKHGLNEHNNTYGCVGGETNPCDCMASREDILSNELSEKIALLSEAKKVLEPLSNSYKANKKGFSVPNVFTNVLSIDLENACEFLAKLEDNANTP